MATERNITLVIRATVPVAFAWSYSASRWPSSVGPAVEPESAGTVIVRPRACWRSEAEKAFESWAAVFDLGHPSQRNPVTQPQRCRIRRAATVVDWSR